MTEQTIGAGEIAAWLAEHIAGLLEIDPSTIDPAASFDTYGLASSDAVFLSGDLSEFLGMELSATLAWDYPSINELSTFLAAVLRGEAELPVEQLEWDLDVDLDEIR